MPCYHPLRAWKAPFDPETGKRGRPVFNERQALCDGLEEMRLPCGQCVGCRLNRSRNWAVRCMHESALWEENSFITLTYGDEFVPPDWSLDVSDFQKFMKRLRKRLWKVYGRRIRVLYSGEYGETLQRPHFHALIFGHAFLDRVEWSRKNDIPLYLSAELQDLWTDPLTLKPLGFATVGELTFESAAYVARYCLKKVTGDAAFWHYCDIDSDGVVVGERKPEFSHMSQGVGRGWIDSFRSDVYPSDEVALIGRKVTQRPPRYYDKILEEEDPVLFEEVQAAREESAERFAEHNTPERLAVREKIAQSRLIQRSL